jgi:hypothetical protein
MDVSIQCSGQIKSAVPIMEQKLSQKRDARAEPEFDEITEKSKNVHI